MAKGTLQIKYEKLVMDNLDLRERIKEQVKELEDISFTKIHCDIKSCLYNKEGLCKHTTIHLHGRTPDADNVVACSEFKSRT